jgi:hypothetical protein
LFIFMLLSLNFLVLLALLGAAINASAPLTILFNWYCNNPKTNRTA